MNKSINIPREINACYPFIKLACDIQANAETLNDAYVVYCLLEKASIVGIGQVNELSFTQSNLRQPMIQLRDHLTFFKSYIDYTTEKGKKALTEMANNALYACEIHDIYDPKSVPVESAYLFTQAAILFETLDIFGRLTDEQQQKLSYCKWKAVQAQYYFANQPMPKVQSRPQVIRKKSMLSLNSQSEPNNVFSSTSLNSANRHLLTGSVYNSNSGHLETIPELSNISTSNSLHQNTPTYNTNTPTPNEIPLTVSNEPIVVTPIESTPNTSNGPIVIVPVDSNSVVPIDSNPVVPSAPVPTIPIVPNDPGLMALHNEFDTVDSTNLHINIPNPTSEESNTINTPSLFPNLDVSDNSSPNSTHNRRQSYIDANKVSIDSSAATLLRSNGSTTPLNPSQMNSSPSSLVNKNINQSMLINSPNFQLNPPSIQHQDSIQPNIDYNPNLQFNQPSIQHITLPTNENESSNDTIPLSREHYQRIKNTIDDIIEALSVHPETCDSSDIMDNLFSIGQILAQY